MSDEQPTLDDLNRIRAGLDAEWNNLQEIKREYYCAFEKVQKMLGEQAQALPRTPSALWRQKGQEDPHGTNYDVERASLTLGSLTDDELANAVFMHGNMVPPLADVLSGKALMPIAYLTAAKERIRWLSRKLEEAQRGATTGEQQ